MRCAYLVRPLKYLIKKPPVPTERATNSLIKVTSRNTLFIRSYLKAVLR